MVEQYGQKGVQTEISRTEIAKTGFVSVHTLPSYCGKRPKRAYSLDVAVREFADAPARDMEVLESIMRSYFDTMSRTIENMVQTLEECRVLEERCARLEKLREDAKELKLDEREIRLELGRIMSEEDRKLLESVEAERTVYS